MSLGFFNVFNVFSMSNSSLSQKLLEFSTLNTSGGPDILNEDILRTYGNLNSSTVMFYILYGTTESLFLPPPTI